MAETVEAAGAETSSLLTHDRISGNGETQHRGVERKCFTPRLFSTTYADRMSESEFLAQVLKSQGRGGNGVTVYPIIDEGFFDLTDCKL